MINKALRLIRQYHQKSQSDLAIELAITKEQLITIENGQSQINSKLLQRYSELFDIPVSSLLFFFEKKRKEGKYTQRIRSSLARKVLYILELIIKKNEKKTIQA